MLSPFNYKLRYYVLKFEFSHICIYLICYSREYGIDLMGNFWYNNLWNVIFLWKVLNSIFFCYKISHFLPRNCAVSKIIVKQLHMYTKIMLENAALWWVNWLFIFCPYFCYWLHDLRIWRSIWVHTNTFDKCCFFRRWGLFFDIITMLVLTKCMFSEI